MLTVERLREILHYDPETGAFTWLVQKSSTASIGAVAGTLSLAGYRQISLDGQIYYAHRLAVLYMTGEWPAAEVDHKDVVPGNDRWENLRPARRGQNGANRNLNSNNSSGFKGVSWCSPRRKWRAQICVNRKNFHLGLFDAPALAHAAYLAAAEQHFGEFARSGA